MLTVQPHLRTRRPSPTTVEYTVSTSPPLTIPLRLLIAVTHLIRIIIILSALLILYAKYQLSSFSTPLPESQQAPPLFSNEYISYALSHILSSPFGQLFYLLASRSPLIVLLPTSFLTLYLLSLRRSITESLLVLRGLGIQTSTSSESYLSTATTRFIPTDRIQDIFVNEAFRGFEVRYLLVVVVEGEKDVVVVFPRLLPRRMVVETVWRGARACLGIGSGLANGREKGDGGKEREREREKERERDRRDGAGYTMGKG